MVGRALLWSLGLVLAANTAMAEEPVAAETELVAVEIVDPYAEPEPRINDVVDPYVESAEQELARLCRNYCLAHKEALSDPPRRLPPPHQTEEWGSRSEKAGSGLDQQALGGLLMGVSALAGMGLLIATANDHGDDLSMGQMAAATGVGVGLLIGFVLIVDADAGKTEVRIASASR